ncbi:MAG: O-antigen ligase family protein [Candidatus Shapirobacteria bacterium]|nr:O-antigen ligase family protein [Candidatus Shapirobacteria bacterium]
MFKKKLHQNFFWLLILLLPFQLGKHFWPNWSYVLGLKVDYLSPTLYLTDILVFLILFLWVWGIRDKRYVIRKILRSCWWVFTIFVFLLVNAFLAQNQGVAFYKFAKIVEFTLLGFYIAKNQYPVSNFELRETRFPYIQYPLAGAVVYSSLIALGQFLKQGSLNGIFWWLGERTFDLATPGIAKTILNGRLVLRPYGIFAHPNALAGFLLVSLILLSNWSVGKNKVIKSIKYLAFILGGLTIIVSFSRSVWFLSLMAVFYFIIHKNHFQKKKLFFISSLFFLFSCLLIVVVPYFSTNEAFSQRKQLMESALLMIRNFPLSGVGLNNFITRLPDYWSLVGFTYWLQPVHNIYFLIAAETGFTGLIIFVWFLILTYRRLFSRLLSSYLVLILGLTTVLFLGLNDHYWLTLQQNQLLLTIVLGLSWSKLS